MFLCRLCGNRVLCNVVLFIPCDVYVVYKCAGFVKVLILGAGRRSSVGKRAGLAYSKVTRSGPKQSRPEPNVCVCGFLELIPPR